MSKEEEKTHFLATGETKDNTLYEFSIDEGHYLYYNGLYYGFTGSILMLDIDERKKVLKFLKSGNFSHCINPDTLLKLDSVKIYKQIILEEDDE
jgi:hypothetical protein